MESENLEDVKSWSTYIPCITKGELEKQFQSVYTHAKVKEFQEQFVGKLDCLCSKTKEGDIVSEYEVKQSITFGEREEAYTKEVSFIVILMLKPMKHIVIVNCLSLEEWCVHIN